MAKKVKKTNVSITSRLAYKEIKAAGLIKSQEALILKLMSAEQKPLTRRKLMMMAGIEAGAACRTVYNLERKKAVEIIKRDKCEITGKLVNYYGLPSQDQQSA